MRVLWVCLAALAGLAALAVFHDRRGSPAQAGPPVAGLQTVLDGIVRADRVPGGVLLLRRHARTQVLASGLADVQTRAPMRPDMHFRVGSVTKLFVATLALQLASERKLSLDDTVNRWLPGLVPNGRHVQVRQLLNQTAGLPEVSILPSYARLARENPVRPVPPRQLVRLVYATPVEVNIPGQQWEYSNTNYLVADMVVEAAARQTLADALQSRIARPLDLSGTSIPATPAMPQTFAHGYLADAKGRVRFASQRLVDVTRQNPSLGAGAGNMVSTTADLGRFIDALLGGNELLSRPQRLAMTTPTRASLLAQRRAQWGYGYGLFTGPCRAAPTTSSKASRPATARTFCAAATERAWPSCS